MNEPVIDQRRHIDISNKDQVNHFLRCWGGSVDGIEKAILATGTTQISKIYAHLHGITFRIGQGFDF